MNLVSDDPFQNTTALVRGYVHFPTRDKRKTPNATESEYKLVFDTETTTDPSQSLRFGFFQFWRKGDLIDSGVFYDREHMLPDELRLLGEYAAANGLEFMSRDEFIEDIFYDQAYAFAATIVGFNLPFDLSRLAIRHNSARGSMRGGFTFQLSKNRYRPRVQVRHLNGRAALIQFAAPPRQRAPRGQRKRGIKVPVRRGSFLDVKTFAAALLSQSFSLRGLADHLETDHRKIETDAHGQALTAEYLDYAATDVQVSKECLDKLLVIFKGHGLTRTSAPQLLSEASVGKAYLRQMGIRPLFETQPDFSPAVIGRIMGAYYGGRTEVRWRRAIKRVLYLDFLSMYPTACTLMGLWSFVIAKGLDVRDTTAETQALLDGVALDHLQHKAFWAKLHTLVRLRPNRDVLPVRARFGEKSATIGLSEVSSDVTLWYTLADVIASKLQTGRTVHIEQAMSFVPREAQDGLHSIRVCGGPHIDPDSADFFKTVIDLRQSIKDMMRQAVGAGKARFHGQQLALKILANSTSYGIFIEMIVNSRDDLQEVICFGSRDRPFATASRKTERPGNFFNPIIATLITGAARLMLSLAECLGRQHGLDWAFCDTDSIAFVKPDEIEEGEFQHRTGQIVRWFEALNPYEKPGSILKIEDVNFALGRCGACLPLYCYAISSKRYVLFNLAEDGTPVIRQASAHGLGHLRPPYAAENAPATIPDPKVNLSDIGIERWQYDLWFAILTAALANELNEVDLTYHPALQLPACSRYAATTPIILRWFRHHNEDKLYPDQVKPFGFLTALMARHSAAISVDGKKTQRPKPIAPFSTHPEEACVGAFDRETGLPVARDRLQTYAQALAQYHLSPETKFLNGDSRNFGRTERRHLCIRTISHIGKEADRWEEQMLVGPQEEDEISYGTGDAGVEERLRLARKKLGEREAALRFGIARMTLRKAVKLGQAAMSHSVRNRLERA